MKRKILVATTNVGKIAELKAMLDLDADWLDLSYYPEVEEIEETIELAELVPVSESMLSLIALVSADVPGGLRIGKVSWMFHWPSIGKYVAGGIGHAKDILSELGSRLRSEIASAQLIPSTLGTEAEPGKKLPPMGLVPVALQD